MKRWHPPAGYPFRSSPRSARDHRASDPRAALDRPQGRGQRALHGGPLPSDEGNGTSDYSVGPEATFSAATISFHTVQSYPLVDRGVLLIRPLMVILRLPGWGVKARLLQLQEITVTPGMGSGVTVPAEIQPNGLGQLAHGEALPQDRLTHQEPDVLVTEAGQAANVNSGFELALPQFMGKVP